MQPGNTNPSLPPAGPSPEPKPAEPVPQPTPTLPAPVPTPAPAPVTMPDAQVVVPASSEDPKDNIPSEEIAELATPAAIIDVPEPPVPLPAPAPPAEAPAQPLGPTAPTDSIMGMTGSQIAPTKTPIPKGIYVIAAITTIGVIASFFDTSQNSLIYTVVLIADLLLTAGLFLRLETARKLVVGLSILLVILSAGLMVGFKMLQGKVAESQHHFETAAEQVRNSGQATPTQQKQLDELQLIFQKQEKQLGKSLVFVYAKYSVTVVACIGVIVYLTRPKVKVAFRDDLSHA